MAGFILGQKDLQSQAYDEKGNLLPVTKIIAAPCYLVNIIWPETQGPRSVQLGFGKAKHISKPTEGKIKKAGIKTPLRFLKEFRVRGNHKDFTVIEEEGKKGILLGEQKVFIGDEVKPSVLFKVGDVIDVSGTSKGKGFQGGVKRHGFAGGPKTHGQSDRERAPGSIGATTTPGRVFKGQRMAGRMGGVRKTIQNLIVMQADDTSLTVKGLVPGAKGGLLEVKTKGL